MTQLLRRIFASGARRIDRHTAGPRNRLADLAYRRDPGAWLDRIDRAIERAHDWLAPQRNVSMSVLFAAKRSMARGIDERFAFVDARLEHYRQTVKDPALRIFDAAYDPDRPPWRDVPDVMQVRPYVPIELLMLDAVWADHRRQPDILDRLRAFDDGGNYGTTHIVLGAHLLLANGGAPADETLALVESVIDSIAAANDRTSRADDIFAERIMMLGWHGRHELIRPAWIIRLLASQRADGGWASANFPPRDGSNQHTTIAAMTALAEFRAAELGRAPAFRADELRDLRSTRRIAAAFTGCDR